MADVAMVTLTGRVGQEPEIKVMPNGDALLSFSVGVKPYKAEETTWYRCSVYGKRGESLAAYLTKGTPVTVIGSLNIRTYTKKDGSTGVSCDVRVAEVVMQGGRQSSDDAPASAPARPVRNAPVEMGDEDLPF